MTDDTPRSAAPQEEASTKAELGSSSPSNPSATAPHTGAMAHSLSKALDEKTDKLVEEPYQPGKVMDLSGGRYFRNRFAEKSNIRTDTSRIHIKIPGGEDGFDITIEPHEASYQDRTTSQGGSSWARDVLEKNGSVSLNIFGQEVLVDTRPNIHDPYISEVSGEVLQDAAEIKKLLNPDDANQLQSLLDKAAAEEDKRRRQHDSVVAQRIQEESAPIYLRVGRSKIEGGRSGIAVIPITDRRNPNIVLLSNNPDTTYGSPEKLETLIDNRGIGIELPAIEDPDEAKRMQKVLAQTSAEHLLIKIDGMTVTVIDGNGENPSSHGTLLQFLPVW